MATQHWKPCMGFFVFHCLRQEVSFVFVFNCANSDGYHPKTFATWLIIVLSGDHKGSGLRSLKYAEYAT